MLCFSFYTLTERMFPIIIRTYVPERCKREEERRGNMAFSCVMQMKEECDGCMRCMERWRCRAQEDNA